MVSIHITHRIIYRILITIFTAREEHFRLHLACGSVNMERAAEQGVRALGWKRLGMSVWNARSWPDGCGWWVDVPDGYIMEFPGLPCRNLHV